MRKCIHAQAPTAQYTFKIPFLAPCQVILFFRTSSLIYIYECFLQKYNSEGADYVTTVRYLVGPWRTETLNISGDV